MARCTDFQATKIEELVKLCQPEATGTTEPLKELTVHYLHLRRGVRNRH